MRINRRDFIEYVSVSAAALGLSTLDLGLLREALANPNAPSVVWLQGAACTGCSVSFLNRIVTSVPRSAGRLRPVATGPRTAADVLINSINLVYHPNLMALAGQSAVDQVDKAYSSSGYFLAVEGGVPGAFGGNTCVAWTSAGNDVTFAKAVGDLASRAKGILCIGTCASWGGIAAAPPNPTAVKGVKAATGKDTINIAGCPPHPDWITWTLVQLLIGNAIATDSSGRPRTLYGQKLHENCPRRESEEAGTFGVEGRCLEELGCRGPETFSNCQSQLFNGGVNWCIGANAPCIGCTQPTFPGSKAFYSQGELGGTDD